MKTPVFKISLKNNIEAIVLNKHFKDNDFELATRIGENLYISKNDMLKEDEGSSPIDWKVDILTLIEDCCMVYEFDYTPEIQEVDFDFEEGLDQI